MGLLLLLVAAAIGWGLWSGKLMPKQLFPLVLVVAGAVLTLKGNWLIGLPAAAIGAFWFRGLTSRLSILRKLPGNQYELAAARWTLGISEGDGADRIRERHRELAAKESGDEERARKLNEARDLLLDDLARKSG